MPQIILQQDLHVKLRNTKQQFLWIFDCWQPPDFGGVVAMGQPGCLRWEIVFMSFSPRLSDPWKVRNGGGLLCVRFIVFYRVYLFIWYIYIDHIGWFSPLLVFQCKCSDVRCFIFGISLAQALLKLCAKLFSWLSYLIFDHAWARARPGWSVPGQK